MNGGFPSAFRIASRGKKKKHLYSCECLVCVCPCVCVSQRTTGRLVPCSCQISCFITSLPYFFEKGSLIDSGARLVARKLQRFSASTFQGCRGCMYANDCLFA